MSAAKRAIRRAVVDEHRLPLGAHAGRARRRARRTGARRCAPRCRSGRRRRSRSLGIAYAAPVDTLPDDRGGAGARARARPAAVCRGRAARGRARARPRRARRAPPSTCRRSRARRWTGSPSGPPTRPGRCRSWLTSRPAGPPARPLAAGEAMAIATGGVVPEGADAVVPIERRPSSLTTASTIPEPSSPARNVRPRGGDVRAGEVVARGGTRLGPAQLGALAAAGVASVRLRARARAPPSSPPGPSCAGRARRSRRARSTSRTAILLAAQLDGGRRGGRAPAAGRRRRGRAPARRSRAGSRPTCSSPRAESRSARTTSCAGSRPSSASRRCSGGSRSSPASRVVFGVRGQTLVFGLPGNPVSTLVGFELFVRPARARASGRWPTRGRAFCRGGSARAVAP